MEMGFFGCYLIIINVIGFLLFAVSTSLYSHMTDKQVDAALTITALLGSSVGNLLSILRLDRKAKKENMMLRVFIASVFVIWIMIFLMLKGYIADNITLAFWTFFNKYKILLVNLGIINFVTFAMFSVDKFAAIEHRSRIKIVTLLDLAFAGGSIGGLLAMYLFRHKIKKGYITVGVPLIIMMQIVEVFYLMSASWLSTGRRAIWN